MASILKNPIILNLYIDRLNKLADNIKIINNDGFEFVLNREVFNSISEYSRNIVKTDIVELPFDSNVLNSFRNVLSGIYLDNGINNNRFSAEDIAHFMIISDYLIVDKQIIDNVIDKFGSDYLVMLSVLLQHYDSLELLKETFFYSEKMVKYIDNIQTLIIPAKFCSLDYKQTVILLKMSPVIDQLIVHINKGLTYSMQIVDMFSDNINHIDPGDISNIVNKIEWMKIPPTLRIKFVENVRENYPEINVDNIIGQASAINKTHMQVININNSRKTIQLLGTINAPDPLQITLIVDIIKCNKLKISIQNGSYLKKIIPNMPGTLVIKIREYYGSTEITKITKCSAIKIPLNKILEESYEAANLFIPEMITDKIKYSFEVVQV